MNYSVFGLGKLGFVVACLLAETGYKIIGFDINKVLINKLKAGEIPYEETGLNELYESCKNNIKYVVDPISAVVDSDASFVIVPTPSNLDGSFSNEYLLTSIEMIVEGIKRKNSKHSVVVMSTVSPGTMDFIKNDFLPLKFNQEVNSLINLIYSPQFIALGNVIKNLREPDFVLVGESNIETKQDSFIENIFSSIHNQKTNFFKMEFINAEITKLALNSFVTMKISYANLLAEICDATPKADVEIITSALGSDSRIGKKYLTGATGYGGPCFPRDNKSLSRYCEKVGVNSELLNSIDLINDRQSIRLANIVRSLKDQHISKIGIFGLSYKENTNVIDESQSIKLFNQLAGDYSIKFYDLNIKDTNKEIIEIGITNLESAETLASWADVLVFMVNDKKYIEMDESILNEKIIIDPWKLFSKKIGKKFIQIGKLLKFENMK